jgi:predicted dehydrogenase
MTATLRVGVLGAAAFATRHGIPRVHAGYADVLADPDVDAVYVPLPNALHGHWTLRALAAGKHVLCEKPLAANRAEAEEVADAADRAGLVVMEALHYRYHPLAERMRTIVRDELGGVRRVDASVCVPLARSGDVRYQYDLAGGALMDTGCYALDVVRLLGGEPPSVVSAAARTLRADRRVDRAVTAELAFPGGATGGVRASIWSHRLLSITARVQGGHGTPS